MTKIDKLIEEIHKGKHGWDGDWHSHIAEPIIRAAMPGILREEYKRGYSLGSQDGYERGRYGQQIDAALKQEAGSEKDVCPNCGGYCYLDPCFSEQI